jgi:hypothetical protein
MADLIRPRRSTRDLSNAPAGNVVDCSASEVHTTAEIRVTIVLLGLYLVAAAYPRPLGLT